MPTMKLRLLAALAVSFAVGCYDSPHVANDRGQAGQGGGDATADAGLIGKNGQGNEHDSAGNGGNAGGSVGGRAGGTTGGVSGGDGPIGAPGDGGPDAAAKSNGVACAAAVECASGQCIDGYCCNVACTGQCVSCGSAGSRGTCVAVATPRTPCAGSGACAGRCDGINAACVYPDNSTSCGAVASCINGVATTAASCNGSGACTPPATVPCALGCRADVPTCLTNCSSTQKACNGSCIAASDCCGGCSGSKPVCTNGACVARSTGDRCGGDTECLTGHCIDGYCCESACAGQCQSCSATPGKCMATTSPRTPCNGSGACGGHCNGINGASCTYPGAEVSCGAASCSAGMAKPAASCNGSGACASPPAMTCMFGCQPGGTTCSSCRQKSNSNILINPGLDGSLTGWTLGGDGAGRYSANDADDCVNSGSISFGSIGDNVTGQCVPAGANATYYLAYRFKAALAVPGSAGDCTISFYADASCANGLATSDQILSGQSDGTMWVLANGSYKSPAGTGGVRVSCAGFAGYGYYDQFYLGTSLGTF